jgi:hypothetical protein
MEYLNDKVLYTRNDAIACFYSYQKTCVLSGVVSYPDKKLVITKEVNFEKQSITIIGQYLNTVDSGVWTNKAWISKNPYLASVLRSCYFLDFSDEQDLCQLTDLFKSLLDENRVLFSCEKQANSNREKTLPILIKALSNQLFSIPSVSGRALTANNLKRMYF